MTYEELVPVRSRWVFSKPKLYGWLVGLFTAFFGGLIYISPGMAYLGLPHAIVGLGLALSLSYAVAMSATQVNRVIIVLITMVALTLIVLGRYAAPITEILDSIHQGRELLKHPSVAAVFGIPMILAGVQLLQLFLPWMRPGPRMSWARSTVSMVLIEGAAVALGIGAAMTHSSERIQDQPHWLWLGVFLAMLVGLGMRVGWKGASWIVAALLVGGSQLLIWALLTWVPVTRFQSASPRHVEPAATAPAVSVPATETVPPAVPEALPAAEPSPVQPVPKPEAWKPPVETEPADATPPGGQPAGDAAKPTDTPPAATP